MNEYPHLPELEDVRWENSVLEIDSRKTQVSSLLSFRTKRIHVSPFLSVSSLAWHHRMKTKKERRSEEKSI
jgi:hypothetical protein